jgi:hypothetical protein
MRGGPYTVVFWQSNHKRGRLNAMAAAPPSLRREKAAPITETASCAEAFTCEASHLFSVSGVFCVLCL